MSIGASLMAMKQNVEAARDEVAAHQKKRGNLYQTTFFIGCLVGAAGFLALTIGMGASFSSSASTKAFGSLLTASGVAGMVLGLIGIVSPLVMEPRDKELMRLKQAVEDAREGYRLSLMSETMTYGVDTATMRDRTDIMNSDYEFTALRDGQPVDITVRDFNNEVIFMLNGERLRKPVHA